MSRQAPILLSIFIALLVFQGLSHKKPNAEAKPRPCYVQYSEIGVVDDEGVETKLQPGCFCDGTREDFGFTQMGWVKRVKECSDGEIQRVVMEFEQEGTMKHE